MSIFLTVPLLSIALSIVGASPLDSPLFSRAIGSTCRAPEGAGSCQSTSNCKGISYPTNLCPNDPTLVQCCVEIACQADNGSGLCRSKQNNGCPGGTFHPGTSAPWPCPGSDDIQCCIPSSTSPSPIPSPPPSSSDVGARILAQAKTAAGLPYAWGGGSCAGPTHDNPPWQNGEIGFDCSGLVCWALCKVTGRDLFSEGLRVTSSMYCASESKLGYKKYPLSQKKAGDAIFFGGKCECGSQGSIHHVGLVVDDNTMWNAPNDRINKVEMAKISSFGETPCPNVIRFTG